jgi:signal transduction histidine kinase
VDTWTAYLAIAIAGLTSLAAVWLLASGARPEWNQVRDSGAGDNRQRLDDIDRKVTLLTRYVEEQIPRVVADSLRSEFKLLSVQSNRVVNTADSDVKVAGDPRDEASIIREIAHSLNTPLAQIEAGVLSMRGTTDEQRRKLDGILDGVRICKSFLAAFREVATLTRDSQAWSPDSLREALRAAATVYVERSGRDTAIEVQVPDSFPGYSNSFVMAVLLPLLENAVEAVRGAGTVAVRGESVGDNFRLTVRNNIAESTLSDEIYRVGYTTKPGHDGLGLPAVCRLLAWRDARIGHRVEDGRVMFTIDLPRGRREY